MNQNISENIAMNPYAKEISSNGGVQMKMVSKKNSVSNNVGHHTGEKRKKTHRFFSAVGNRSSDDEIDASTQLPRTDIDNQASVEGSVTISQPMYQTQSCFNDANTD